MTDAELDAMIAALQPVLRLDVAPAWQEAVRRNLRVTLGHAMNMASVPLDDAAEPAPVFQP